MNASNELREALADAYAGHRDWVLAATAAGLDPSHIALQGSSFVVWTNILRAVRAHNRLDDLRELVARQHSDLLPLLEQYAADLAHGGGELTDLPELAAVALSDGDLDAEQVVRSLAFEETLRVGLLDLALTADVPRGEVIDAALGGARAAEAKARLAHYLTQQERALAPFETRRRAVVAREKELSQQIATTERAQFPRPLIVPPLVDLPPTQRDYFQAQYTAASKQYDATVTHYRAEQNALPGIRAEVQAAGRDLAQLDATIAGIKAQTAAGEPAFHRAVEEARDQDLVLELGRMLSKASGAFRSGAEPFKGFWTLLAASCVLDFIERAVANAAFATEARLRFTSDAEALMPLVQRGLAAIARGCLAGPTVIARALAANGATVAALGKRLGELPSARLIEGTQRARAIIAAPPEIPPFAHLEHPAEIDAMARQLTELRASISSQVTCLRVELGDDLRRDVGLVFDDAATTIDATRTAGEKLGVVLARSRALWILIGHGASSGELPALARTLCAALPHEFARRTETKPSVVIGTASDTVFALKDAQALVGTPVLTDYVKSGEELRDTLASSERRGTDIEAALAALAVLIDGTVGRYRINLNWIAGIAFVPVIGFFLAIWALHIVGRLRPLVASGEARYVELGRDARWMLLVASALSGIAAVIAIPEASDALRGTEEEWLVVASASCVFAFVLFLWSLVAAWLLKPAVAGGLGRAGFAGGNFNEQGLSEQVSANEPVLDPSQREKR